AADGGARAAPGPAAPDPLGRQRAAAHAEPAVLLGVDVVRDPRHLELAGQAPAERLGQRRLPRADGPADPELQRPRNRLHDRNNLMSSVAWRMPAISSAGVKLQSSSARAVAAAAASRPIRPRIAARTRCPSIFSI